MEVVGVEDGGTNGGCGREILIVTDSIVQDG